MPKSILSFSPGVLHLLNMWCSSIKKTNQPTNQPTQPNPAQPNESNRNQTKPTKPNQTKPKQTKQQNKTKTKQKQKQNKQNVAIEWATSTYGSSLGLCQWMFCEHWWEQIPAKYRDLTVLTTVWHKVSGLCSMRVGLHKTEKCDVMV